MSSPLHANIASSLYWLTTPESVSIVQPHYKTLHMVANTPELMDLLLSASSAVTGIYPPASPVSLALHSALLSAISFGASSSEVDLDALVLDPISPTIYGSAQTDHQRHFDDPHDQYGFHAFHPLLVATPHIAITMKLPDTIRLCVSPNTSSLVKRKLFQLPLTLFLNILDCFRDLFQIELRFTKNEVNCLSDISDMLKDFHSCLLGVDYFDSLSVCKHIPRPVSLYDPHSPCRIPTSEPWLSALAPKLTWPSFIRLSPELLAHDMLPPMPSTWTIISQKRHRFENNNHHNSLAILVELRFPMRAPSPLSASHSDICPYKQKPLLPLLTSLPTEVQNRIFMYTFDEYIPRCNIQHGRSWRNENPIRVTPVRWYSAQQKNSSLLEFYLQVVILTHLRDSTIHSHYDHSQYQVPEDHQGSVLSVHHPFHLIEFGLVPLRSPTHASPSLQRISPRIYFDHVLVHPCESAPRCPHHQKESPPPTV